MSVCPSICPFICHNVILSVQELDPILAILSQNVTNTVRAVGTCLQVEGQGPKWGGQKEGILSKNLYFEGIFVKIAKGGGKLPPLPPWFQQPCL